MKKLTLILMTALFAVTCVFGQGPNVAKGQNAGIKKESKAERKPLRKLEGNIVSNTAKTNFLSDFRGVSDVHWARVNTFDEASFIMDGKAVKAFYDNEGNLVGTTSPRTIKDLPAMAQKEISTKYGDYKVTNVILFDDNDINSTDMLLYGTQFDDEDNYFVELSKGTDKTILRVDMKGYVYFFKKL